MPSLVHKPLDLRPPRPEPPSLAQPSKGSLMCPCAIPGGGGGLGEGEIWGGKLWRWNNLRFFFASV